MMDLVEMKPTLYVSPKDLPGLKDMEVGREYELLVKVKLVSMNENQYEGEQTRISGTLEVQGMKPATKSIKEMDNGEFKAFSSRIRSQG